MNVSIANQQKQIRISKSDLKRLALFFLNKSSARSGIQWGAISVVLVDDQMSRIINHSCLNHDYPTDVISFNFEPIPGQTDENMDGEIVINVELAFRLGPSYKGPAYELALYLAHGCDHLSGADDNTPIARRRMRRRELQWLKDAKTQGLSLKLS